MELQSETDRCGDLSRKVLLLKHTELPTLPTTQGSLYNKEIHVLLLSH